LEDYDHDDDCDHEPCEASFFTHRVRKTPTLKDFKLPSDRQKYDDLEDPESWLIDYLQTIIMLGGTKTTAV
jgi:hypothetical protein